MVPLNPVELHTRPNTFYFLYGTSAHSICVEITMRYCNIFFVAGRRAVTDLMTIRCYVARLNACCAMVFVRGIILHNERTFYR
jgi:hypothetical protein